MHRSSYFSAFYSPSVGLARNNILLLSLLDTCATLRTRLAFIFTVIWFHVDLFCFGPPPLAVSISLICHVELDCRSTQGLIRLEKDRHSVGHSLHQTPEPQTPSMVKVNMKFLKMQRALIYVFNATSWVLGFTVLHDDLFMPH